MKRLLILTVFFLFFSFSLYAFSFVFDETSVGIENDGLSLDISITGIRMKSQHFSFGAVDTGGDIMRINNPHFSYSYGLYYSIPKKGTSLLASTLKRKNMWISLFYGERNGIGVSYKKDDLRFFIYSFMKGEGEGIQKSLIERRDTNVLYLGLESRMKMLSLSYYLSVTDSLFCSSLIKSELCFNVIKLGVGYGRLQSMMKESKDWDTSLKLSLFKGEMEVTFSLYLSPLPIYFSSFRSLSFSSKGVVTLGDVIIESEAKRSFRGGKEDVDASISLSYQNWRVKVSKNSGVTFSMHFDSSSFTITNDKIETNVVLRKDEIEMVIDSSGDNSVKGKIDTYSPA